MPSFDIVSEVDTQEIDNALNQARKELVTRFDLKDAKTEIIPEQDKIILIADDGAHLKALREIVIGKLSKRGVDLRNVEQEEPAISSVGHARQELKIKQGLEGNKAKEIIQAIKSQGFKVQASCRTGKFASREKRKTTCKLSFNSCVIATSVLRQTSRTLGTEQRKIFLWLQTALSRLSLCFPLSNVIKLCFSFAIVWVRSDALLILLLRLVEFPKLDENVALAAPCAGKFIGSAHIRRQVRVVLGFFERVHGFRPVLFERVYFAEFSEILRVEGRELQRLVKRSLGVIKAAQIL